MNEQIPMRFVCFFFYQEKRRVTGHFLVLCEGVLNFMLVLHCCNMC